MLIVCRCFRFPETVTAISFELQGVYDQAQESYEQVMKKARELHNVGPAPSSVIPEYKLWEEHWCKYVYSASSYIVPLSPIQMCEGARSVGNTH